MLDAQASNEHGYRRAHAARLRTQQLTSGEARLVVLLIAAAVVASAAWTATWAKSSISLQIIDDFVGQWVPHEPEHRLVGATPAEASLCTDTQPATFAPEFASLAQTVGDGIGQPLECAHADPATDDVLQPTSTGLAIHRASSNLAIFTDGYRHWALGRQGPVTWDGDAVDPPV